MPTPVVGDRLDVCDLVIVDELDRAEVEVPVLRAVEPCAEAPQLCDEAGLVHGEVADDVLSEQELSDDVRLEVRMSPATVGKERILVGEDEPGARITSGTVDDTRERIHGEHIILIHERDPLAAGRIDGLVRCCDDPAVPLTAQQLDPRIFQGDAEGRVVHPSPDPSSQITSCPFRYHCARMLSNASARQARSGRWTGITMVTSGPAAGSPVLRCQRSYAFGPWSSDRAIQA